MLTSSEPHRTVADVDHRAGSVPALEADIRLSVPARPENVSVVRQLVGAFGAAIGLAASTVEDMRLAVTEACTNVVRHAYGDEGGHIDVVIRPTGEAIDVIVSDGGRGLGPSPDAAGPGLGLSLIAALADRLEIEHAPRQGSRLAMSFLRRQAPAGAL